MIPTPATDPEDLFNTIKRPDRYYRVMLIGTYIECVMKHIPDKAYDFWKHMPLQCAEYVQSPGQFSAQYNVPKYADFMLLDGGHPNGLLDYWSPLHLIYQTWYAMAEPLHEYFGGEFDTLTLEVVEIEELTYFANQLGPKPLIKDASVSMLIKSNQLMLKQREAVKRIKDIDTNVVSMIETSHRVAYDAFVHTNAKFDSRLLVINTAIQPDGVEIIENIMYNGVILDDENYDVVKHKTNFEVELFQFGKFPGTK